MSQKRTNCLWYFPSPWAYWLILLISVCPGLYGITFSPDFISLISLSCPIGSWRQALAVNDQSQRSWWRVRGGSPLDKRWGIWFCVSTAPRVHEADSSERWGGRMCAGDERRVGCQTFWPVWIYSQQWSIDGGIVWAVLKTVGLIGLFLEKPGKIVTRRVI